VKRKEILLFQLREVRNEFLDALVDLTPEQLIARPLPDQNPIGWIVCHCLNNFDHFLYQVQTGGTLLSKGGKVESLARYAWHDPTADNPPPDLSSLPAAVEEVFGACIEVIERLDEEALDRPGPFWRHERYETAAANCVRVVNHSNTHLRDVWMLRGALGDRNHFPRQTLYKRSNEEGGVFWVPERSKVLADREQRRG